MQILTGDWATGELMDEWNDDIPRFGEGDENFRQLISKTVKRGDWNKIMITANGDHFTVRQNGVITLDVEHAIGPKSGRISFKLGDDARFRAKEIEIAELPDDSQDAAK